MEDIVERLPTGLSWPQDKAETLAAFISDQNRLHADEIVSFQRAYRVELHGAFVAFEPVLQEALAQHYETLTGARPSEEDLAHFDQIPLPTFFYNACSVLKLHRRLPSFHLQAALHARMRLEKGRQFKPNDFADFGHAVAAVPYCSFFLTEASLSHILGSPLLRIQEDFGAVIFSSAPQAIAAFRPG